MSQKSSSLITLSPSLSVSRGLAYSMNNIPFNYRIVQEKFLLPYMAIVIPENWTVDKVIGFANLTDNLHLIIDSLRWRRNCENKTMKTKKKKKLYWTHLPPFCANPSTSVSLCYHTTSIISASPPHRPLQHKCFCCGRAKEFTRNTRASPVRKLFAIYNQLTT